MPPSIFLPLFFATVDFNQFNLGSLLFLLLRFFKAIWAAFFFATQIFDRFDFGSLPFSLA